MHRYMQLYTRRERIYGRQQQINMKTRKYVFKHIYTRRFMCTYIHRASIYPRQQQLNMKTTKDKY